MSHGRKDIGEKGFSLTETLIAVCVMTLLAGLAGLQYSVWIKRYNIEREAREMYADFMNARARAMMRNRLHFVDFTNGRYTIYEDTYDVTQGSSTPDGDGKLQKTTPGDDVVFQKNTRYTVEPHFGFGATRFYFNRNGLSSMDGSVRLTSDVLADYDCVTIYRTRLHLGKWNGTTCKATL